MYLTWELRTSSGPTESESPIGRPPTSTLVVPPATTTSSGLPNKLYFYLPIERTLPSGGRDLNKKVDGKVINRKVSPQALGKGMGEIRSQARFKVVLRGNYIEQQLKLMEKVLYIEPCTM